MDVHDYINDIMFHIFNDKTLIDKLKTDCKNTSLVLEVRLDNKEEIQENMNINMYKKTNKTHFIKKNLPKYKKVKKENTSEQCSICLEEYVENTYMRTLECHHHFHKKCIDKWLKKCDDENIHCPICRNQYNIPLEFVSNFSIQKTIQ